MQCCSDGTLTGEKFANHAFYLLAEACLIEIQAEDIPSGV
jgi:hypothetical protein